VRGGALLPDEHQFVLRAIKRPHPGVALVPDAEILKLVIDSVTGRQHLRHVPPVHAGRVDRAVDGVVRQEAEYRLEESGELCCVHLAAAHGEVGVPDPAEPANVAVDRHVVRRIRKHELGLGVVQ
jgi:hypothetical protein